MSCRKYEISRNGDVENMVCRGKILSTKSAVGETFCREYGLSAKKRGAMQNSEEDITEGSGFAKKQDAIHNSEEDIS
ncbi:hypothetical protein C2G38_2180979 [Gigaspora rosea]|uniref:Uncharacterized protein n=1 Tax=Gigaspora rosea TaxID=44941 RepID=A0A397VFK2_9GLOM|nr:hypothetical protein C2G38_2180979 [Gigaspora rosea]